MKKRYLLAGALAAAAGVAVARLSSQGPAIEQGKKDAEAYDPRGRKYYTKIGDTTIAFDYLPGFERVFTDVIPHDILNEAYFRNDESGELIHIELAEGRGLSAEDEMNVFIRSSMADGYQIITDCIAEDDSGDYSGFCFWTRKDLEVLNPKRKNYFRTGCNIFDETGEIWITCIGNHMPMMFKDIEVIRNIGLCTEGMEAE